jgi:hypothetical protein
MAEDDDFGLFAAEEQEQETGSLRALSAPITMDSDALTERYRNITHDTIHSGTGPLVFEDFDNPHADGSPRLEVMIGTGQIGNPDNPAAITILKEEV